MCMYANDVRKTGVWYLRYFEDKEKKHKTVTEMSQLGAEPSPVPVPATTHTTVD